MSWHYLQGQEAASWEGGCLDGAPDALLRLMPTPDRSCSQDKPTEVLSDSLSGMTSAPLTADLGEEALTSSPEAFLAKISQLLDEEQGSQERGQGFGRKWLESSMRYDLATHGWRTHRCLWDEALSLSSVTLPRWGMMQDGVLWERITQEHLTSETGYGYWPTPRANESRESLETIQARKERTGIGHINLTAAVKSWPTPQASEARQGFQDRTSGKKGSQKSLSTIVQGAPAKEAGGALNPSWVEWLMGWPVDWTDITKSCAGNFAQWQAEQAEWWDAEPDDVPRVINGGQSRVNRLHAIGNGQVPAALVLAWTILTEE